MLMPREKITVLLVGNHSAGKSSFINWYIEEKVIESANLSDSGFTFLCHRSRRQAWQWRPQGSRLVSKHCVT